MGYDYAKAFHIIAVIAWMAGMLYLPRLFVYHAGVAKGSPESAIFKIMERRLLKAIMTPAMVIVWALGFWLVMQSGFGTPDNPADWLFAKLVLVLGMSGLHGFFAATTRTFAADENTRSPKFYKVINELVTVLLIGIVLLVVTKPF